MRILPDPSSNQVLEIFRPLKKIAGLAGLSEDDTSTVIEEFIINIQGKKIEQALVE